MQTDNELLIRIDERLKSLSDKLDAFMKSVKDNYVDKIEFESWKNTEFSPVKQMFDQNARYKILFIGSIISGVISLIVSLFKK